MSDGEPRPLLFYSRRRRGADDDADDLGDSPGDRAVRPRANPDSADSAIEAPPRHPRVPPPVAHAPDDSSASTPRRGLVRLSRLGAGAEGAPAPPRPGAAPAAPLPRPGAAPAAPLPRPGAAPAAPRPGAAPAAHLPRPGAARGAWSTALRHPSVPPGPQSPGSSPSTTGPLQPGGGFCSRSLATPAAPVTPVTIVPPLRPTTSTRKVHPTDNTPRDLSISQGLRQGADLPVACIHGDASARGVDEVRDVLIKLLSHNYVQALQKLPMDEIPELLSCVVYAGHAYGILEPINNIIVNAINFYRSRGKYTGHQIDGSIYDPEYWAEAANSSLRGLVVLLRSYFSCLSEEQALGYLYLSNADPVHAIGLVERDQNIVCSFHKVSMRTEVAVILAAYSAEHPNPRGVANTMTGSYLSSSIERLRMRLRPTKISRKAVLDVASLFEGYTLGFGSEEGKTLYSLRVELLVPFDPVQPKSKQRRREWATLDDAECGYIKMLKMLILDGDLKRYHLDAISQLSSAAVSRLHRGLVVAGYSCGFFDIPAYNVIINAIWHTLVFPPNDQENDMPVSLLCSDRMFNVTQQSLVGSVAFLQERYKGMSKHEAVEFLYYTRGNLHDADKLAGASGHSLSCSGQKALNAAVKSMGCMWVNEMLKLVNVLDSGLGSQVQSVLLTVEGEISVGLINSLKNMLSQRLSPPLTSLPILVSPLSTSAKAKLAATGGA